MSYLLILLCNCSKWSCHTFLGRNSCTESIWKIKSCECAQFDQDPIYCSWHLCQVAFFPLRRELKTTIRQITAHIFFIMNFSDENIFLSLIWRKYQKNFSTNLILKTNDNHLYNINYIQLLPTVVFSKLIHLQQQH